MYMYIYVYRYVFLYIDIYRIECPLGRKPEGSIRAEEKPLRDTACRLRRKGLDMPCDSY